MNTKKLRLTAFFIALALFAASVAGLFLSRISASAAPYNAATLFATSTRSEVIAEANENMKFSFEGTTNNAVNYNRNLAYKWFSMDEDSSAEEPTENYLSLAFSFEQPATFETFAVTFQSAENSKSADDVTENQIVFFNENGTYSVAVRNDDDADVADADLDKTVLTSLGDVTVSFGAGAKSGEYAVRITVDSQTVDGTFTNIRGSYAQYTASELVPLSFAAKLPAEDSAATVVSLVSLNGQGFLLNEDAQVVDDTPPVLVVNDDIKTFVLGTSLLNSFSYASIDVCDSTVTRTATYYQYASEDTEPEYTSLTTSVRIMDKELYAERGYELVSVRFVLNDDDNNQEEYFLSWYAEDRADDVVTESGMDGVEFLKVMRDDQAPAYTCIENANTAAQAFVENQAYLDYVADVELASEDLRAGNGYYFYLPSLEDLIADNDTPYTGLNFTIYYKSDASESASTRSNLSYDELEIPVSTTGGYIFKVVATDKQGNAMKFYDKNGNLVTVDSDTVWDIDVIPSFSFYVENKGLEVEKTEELTYAYVYSNYTIEDIEVKGLSGYESKYSLYYLDGVSANTIDYATLISFANECYEDGIDVKDFKAKLAEKTGLDLSDAEMRKISEWDDNGPADEDDEGWETHDNRYSWRASSRSFTPQESGYYIMFVELADSEVSSSVYAYQIVYASSEVDQIYGETYWIENNVVTVVFIVIAVISAIALLVIWITFPAEEKAGKGGNAKAAGGKFADKRKNTSENKKSGTDKK